MFYRFTEIQISDETRDKFWSLMYFFEISNNCHIYVEMYKNVLVPELVSLQKINNFYFLISPHFYHMIRVVNKCNMLRHVSQMRVLFHL